MTIQTEHIKKGWIKLLARLQGMRNQHPRASAIYKLTVLVSSDGLPLFFTRPKIIVLEPGSVDALGRLRRTLTESLNGGSVKKEEFEAQIAEVLNLMGD